MLNAGISISVAGFVGAFGILLLILGVSSRYGYGAIILLFGVIIGQLTGALQSLLSYIAIPTDLKNYTLWSMGSFNQVIGPDLLILGIVTMIGLTWSFFLMPSLSVMLLGDDVSRTLGVNTRHVSMKLLACTGLLTGITTAYCGPIAFIGMAIPNVVRLLFKTADFKYLLLMNAFFGAAMALISDILSSLPIGHINIPVNVTTALIGGPFIIYVLLKNRN
jgi:iron complex transport system permease protein